MTIAYKKLLKLGNIFISPLFKTIWNPVITDSGAFFHLKSVKPIGKNKPGIHFTKSIYSKELNDYPGVLVKCSLGGDIIEGEDGYISEEAFILDWYDEDFNPIPAVVSPFEINAKEFVEFCTTRSKWNTFINSIRKITLPVLTDNEKLVQSKMFFNQDVYNPEGSLYINVNFFVNNIEEESLLKILLFLNYADDKILFLESLKLSGLLLLNKLILKGIRIKYAGCVYGLHYIMITGCRKYIVIENIDEFVLNILKGEKNE